MEIGFGTGISLSKSNPAAADPIGDALRADCVAYWKMDEASGNRADATGRGNTLSEQGGTVNSVSGLLGNAARFVGTNYLGRADNADVSFTGDWSMSLFFRPQSASSGQTVINKLQLAPTFEVELNLYVGNADNDLSAELQSDDGSQGVATTDTTFGDFTTNVWIFIALTYDNTLKKLGISINSGAFDYDDNVSFSQPSLSAPFNVGGEPDAEYTKLTADVQHLAKYSGIITSDEITYLYNGGSGRSLY